MIVARRQSSSSSLLLVDVSLLLTLLLSHFNVVVVDAASSESTYRASMCKDDRAYICFRELMASVPCSHPDHAFRCPHFRVLDACFREYKTICTAETLGQIAKRAYRRRMQICEQQSKRLRDVPSRSSSSSSSRRLPSELQFVALFGFLQTQCLYQPPTQNCTGDEFERRLDTCEQSIKYSARFDTSDYERHQLLRVKLDTSSRLLGYEATKRVDECLIVRSALSDVVAIHHRHCLQTVIVRCLCERLNFAHYCDVDCTNLEPPDAATHRVSWDEFRARLVSVVDYGDGENAASFCVSWLGLLMVQLLFVFLLNRRL